MKKYEELKEEALCKRRRVIFDNDGGDVAIQCTKATPEELLEKRTTKLIRNGVDTLIYVTRSSGFGQFTHNTKNGQLFTVVEDRYCNNIAHKLIENGKDCLQIILEYCHDNELEVFWGMRMNDTHDAAKEPGPKACFYNNKIKSQHPERLLINRTKKQKYGAWSAVDYALEDIREYAYKFVEEICENYDIDGVELDFFRHPVFFASVADGEAASSDECRQMTELLIRIKEMIIKKSVQRQRAILFAVKVPDSLGYCKKIGLDLKTWLERGLIDILITGGYFKLNDHDYSVKLAKKYNVKYVASLDENRIADPDARVDRDSLKCYRGRAQNAFYAGASGVFLFNYNGIDLKQFSASNANLTKELAEEKTLERLNKDYFVSIRGMGRAAGGNTPYDEYMNMPVLNPALAVTLDCGEIYETYIIIGEDIKKNDGKAKLCVRMQGDISVFKITVNGFDVFYEGKVDLYHIFQIDVDFLNVGRNDIKIICSLSKGIVEDIKISVFYDSL